MKHKNKIVYCPKCYSANDIPNIVCKNPSCKTGIEVRRSDTWDNDHYPDGLYMKKNQKITELRWTSERPTEYGFYCFLEEETHGIDCGLVKPVYNVQKGSEETHFRSFNINDLKGKWFGPLPWMFDFQLDQIMNNIE